MCLGVNSLDCFLVEMERSDGSLIGGEIDMEGEGEGNSKEEWQVVGRGAKRDRVSEGNLESDKGNPNKAMRVINDKELKVKLQFDSPISINPLKITKALHAAVGTVQVTPVRDGSLLIGCYNAAQRDKLLAMSEMDGKKIKCTYWERKKLELGVITDVSTDLPCEDIMSNVSGANVVKCRRLMFTRDRIKKESLSVLLFFDEKVLPTRIRVGYMSFQVRPYIPPPLRCFNCQKFGHVAAICRGKRRCGKCGGEDHEYGQCKEGTSVKCCNCGGSHSAAYKGCQAHKKASEVQRVKVEEKLTYAEAIKKVDGRRKLETGQRQQGQRQSVISQQSKESPSPICADAIKVDSVKFLAFLAEVINCSAVTESRSERIKVIVKAAQKHFRVGAEVSVDEITKALNILQGVQATSQSASCGGS